MKRILMLTGLSLVLNLAAAAHAESYLRFGIVYDIREAETMPAQLFATIDLGCNETVYQTLRENVIDATGVYQVQIGALVSVDDQMVCTLPAQPTSLSFGPLYSGLPYQVRAIQKP